MDHEKELLDRARRGDTEAFDEIVTLHRQRVYSLAFQILRNSDDAMDVAQETFLKAWRSLAKFDGGHPVGTWLHRIATNAAIDIVRRRQNRPQCAIDDVELAVDAASRTTPSAPEAPGVGMDRRDLRGRLDAALASLSPEHRAVIILREVEELSYEEIAARTNTSTGTVMSRLYYARRYLQTRLKDTHEEF
jgi:RNA polymerase sigma-70 factor (ECF subfamily)